MIVKNNYSLCYNYFIMKKKIFIFVVLLFVPIVVFAKPEEAYSNNVLVYNLNDNEILYVKNEKDRVPIASLTKVMTTIVALENIKELDEVVKFPKIPYLYDYSRIGFKLNEELTYRDLLYSAILPSAADATEALGILISGSTDEFVKLMNDKAKELDMGNTSFSNTYGKDSESNYSTMEDLLKLIKYALKNPDFYKIFTTKSYELTNGKAIKNSVLYYNKESSLDVSPIIGAKTGYTSKAGYCMISIYQKNNMNILIITTNANAKLDKPTHVIDAVDIGEYFIKNYKYFYVVGEGEYIGDIKVLGIKEKVYSDKEIKLYLPVDTNIETELKVFKSTDYNLKVSDKIGEYIIKYGDTKLIEDVKVPNTFKMKVLLSINKIVFKIKRIFA